MRIFKWLLVLLVVVLVGIQFSQPDRSNPAVDPAHELAAHADLPPQVAAILERSCSDCHSNQTRWPWYSRVAPTSWWLADHVRHAREHMNLSEWGTYDAKQAEHILEEVCEEVEGGKMPLPSYLWVHRGARLSQEEVAVLCEWTRAERAAIALRAKPQSEQQTKPAHDHSTHSH